MLYLVLVPAVVLEFCVSSESASRSIELPMCTFICFESVSAPSLFLFRNRLSFILICDSVGYSGGILGFFVEV